MQSLYRMAGASLVALPFLVHCVTAGGDDPGAGAGAATGGGGGSNGGGLAVGGAGGTGLSGDGGAQGGHGGSKGGAGGQAPSLCNNGKIDPPEACDGTEFGGKTCADYGLAQGDLVCNGFCQVVVSGCTPAENCNNDDDDDKDGLIDCLDTDCMAAAGCLDSCAATKSVPLPFSKIGRLLGRANTYAPSCAATSGSELVYEIQPSFTGKLAIMAGGNNLDLTIAVTTTCGVVTDEIACINNIRKFGSEALQIDVTAGTTYFVVIDAVGAAGSPFVKMHEATTTELSCDDFNDNDADGMIDCDDPSTCQGTFSCTPKASAVSVGQACSNHNKCLATGGDPICLRPFWGFSQGYCSEFCDLNADDCPSGSHCYDMGISKHGVCLDDCAGPADCRNGYSCAELGLSSKVCFKAPETACENYLDDDQDALTDCEDPTGCQSTAACTPGPGAVSASCNKHSDCSSNAGSDPVCISAGNPHFWPNGYCSEFCNIADNDCPSGSACVDTLFWKSGSGNCLKTCVTKNDCNPDPEYQCLSLGGPKVCVVAPAIFEI